MERRNARATARRQDPVILAMMAAALAIPLAFLSVAVVRPLVEGDHQTFADMIVGPVAYDGTNKSGELRLVYAAMAAFFFWALMVLPVAHRVLRHRWVQPDSRLWRRRMAIVAPLSALLAVSGARFALSSVEGRRSGEAAFYVAGTVVFMAIVVIRRSRMTSLVLPLLLGGFLFVDVVVILALAARWSRSGSFHLALPSWAGAFLLGAAVVAALAALRAGRSEALDARLGRLVLWAQVPLPLVLLLPFLGVYLYRGTVRPFPVQPAAVAAVGLITALMVAGSVRAARRRASLVAHGAREASALILLSSVVAVAAFVNWQEPAASSFAAADDFHIGEEIIQLDQMATWRQRPFETFIPLPGLVGAVTGAVNEGFFAGSAASWPLAVNGLRVLAGVLTALALTVVVSRGWALGLASFPLQGLLVTTDRLYFVIPTMLLLAAPGLLRRPNLWMPAWALAVALNLALVPAVGLAFLLASAPVAAWQGFRLLSANRLRGHVLGLAGTAAVAAVSAPLLVPLLRFVRSSAADNVPVYGIALFPLRAPTDLVGQHLPAGVWTTVFQVSRQAGWLLVLPMLGALLLVIGTRRSWRAGGHGVAFAAVAVPAVGFLVFITPYAYGRIDPVELSRLGLVSLPFLAVIGPAAMLLLGAKGARFVALTWVALASLVWGLFVPATPTSAAEGILSPVTVPDSAVAVPAAARATYSNIGDTFLERDQVDRLQRLAAVTGAVLRPGETYYDMVNRSVYYFLLRRPLPTRLPSSYYAADFNEQRRAITQLERHPPPLVWVGPALAHDGSNAAVRSYRIYRWFLTRGYRYWSSGDLEFLVRADRYGNLPPTERDDLHGAIHAFTQPSFKRAPLSWGRSFASMRRRFAQPVPLRRTGDEEIARSSWEIPAAVSGARHDFWLGDVRCPDRRVVPARLVWADPPTGERFEMQLLAGTGPILMPMGAHPAWLLRPLPRVLTLELDPGSGCHHPRVGTSQLLRLQR
jgi:hypothetical protein